MKSIRIFFGIGFFQSNFEEIYKHNWDISNSNEINEVVFDLKIVEWINTEEIAILFSWIRHLNINGKKVKIIIPFTNNIFVGYLKTKEELE